MNEYVVSEDELKEMTITLCEIGKEKGYTVKHFALLLSMCAKYLADTVGIQIHAVEEIPDSVH